MVHDDDRRNQWLHIATLVDESELLHNIGGTVEWSNAVGSGLGAAFPQLVVQAVLER